jgi:hypothetical protein
MAADTGRWLRNKVDGTIYGWNQYLANNPKCEEVTHEEAFPEKYVKPEAAAKIAKARGGKKPPLAGEEVVPVKDDVDNIVEELSADASRNLPK